MCVLPQDEPRSQRRAAAVHVSSLQVLYRVAQCRVPEAEAIAYNGEEDARANKEHGRLKVGDPVRPPKEPPPRPYRKLGWRHSLSLKMGREDAVQIRMRHW